MTSYNMNIKVLLLSITLFLCSCSSNKDIQNYEEQEFAKISERMKLITSDYSRGKLSKDEALDLFQMQGNSIEIILAAVEGLRKLK